MLLWWPVAAGLCALSSVPLLPSGPGVWKVSLTLVVPALGVAAIAIAYATLQARKFGRVELELDTIPARIGGELRATVVAARALPEDARLRFRLTCELRSHPGLSKPKTETVWEQTRTVQGYAVVIALPETVSATRSCPEVRITRTLRVRSELPGIDFAASFEVPVYEESFA